MKQLTAHQQFKNAIKWLHELKITKKKKGIGRLCNPKGEHCCLGIGGKMFKMRPKEGYNIGYDPRFLKKVGINNSLMIFDINDNKCEYDKNFKEVRKNIIKNVYNIFEWNVAKKLDKYFNRKPK